MKTLLHSNWLKYSLSEKKGSRSPEMKNSFIPESDVFKLENLIFCYR